MAESPSRRIARTFLALGLGEAVGRVLGFATTLLLARMLGAESYGVVALALAIGLYLTKASECGLEGVGVKAVAEGASDPAAMASAVSGLRLLLALALGAVVASVAWVSLPDPERWVVPLSLLALGPIALDLRWVLVGLEDAAPVGRARVAAEALTLAGVALLVRDAGDLGPTVLLYALGFGASSGLMWFALHARGVQVRVRWNPTLAGPLLRSGLPIAGQILLGLLIFNSDLFFLRWLASLEAVGLYAAAYTLIAFFGNVAYAYSASVLPVLARERSEGRDGAQLFADAYVRALTLAIPLALATAVLAESIIQFGFGTDYAGAGQALAWLSLSLPFSAITALAWSALTTGERHAWLIGSTAIAAAMNVVLNIGLIPAYGLAGAAAATVATEVTRAAIMSRVASRDGLALPPLTRLLRPVLASIAMLVSLWAVGWSLWWGTPLGAVVFFATLAALGGLRVEDGRPVLCD